MRKFNRFWYKLIFFLTAVASILANGKKIFAAETPYNSDWVNWGQHHYSSYTSPWVSYGVFDPGTNNEVRPWYWYCLDSSNLGITIRYYDPQDGRNTFYYLSRSSQVTSFFEENRAGQSQTNLTLSPVTNETLIIDSDFQNLFDGIVGTCYFGVIGNFYTEDIIQFTTDITCTSSQDLYNQLQRMGWQNPAGSGDLSGDLPFLTYTLTQKNVPLSGMNLFSIKEIFRWNYEEKEPYKSSSTNYTFDVMASANFTQASVGEIWNANDYRINPINQTYLTNGGQNISVNEFSFTYDEVGRMVWSKSGKQWRNDSINAPALGYILYIRTRSNDGTKASFWKIYKVQAGGYVTSTGKAIDNNGQVVDATTLPGGQDNINPGTTPPPGYDPSNQTTTQTDPTSDLYDGEARFNISTMIATLKAIVNGITELPSIMSQLLTFLPSWLPTMIALSIGMLVVIGVVKAIIN